ncbi:Glucosidase 2 subunit beta [Ceratocystis platani]|uniref:Glucosidase 2 subunit beta n=1 Tax=Ceratocystis fimbriata f. sp. platani TaxID=88771 RepID=A0A0F8AWW8_CERFI|nr:Glucosidase 2 subunit beta [Ceratocystis platani]
MKSLALFIGTSSLLSAASASKALPRGVGPEYAQHYSSKDSFSCINYPGTNINPSQINDNSCDCPDGSDEPGTAACASLDVLSPPQPLPGAASGTTQTSNALPGFWCANSGHIGAYVPFMFVNDGVCDYDLCCDGTDEWAGAGGVKCPNKCAEIGKEFRQKAAENQAALDRALKKKTDILTQAQKLRLQITQRIAALQQELKTEEANRDELERKRNDAEKAERGKVVRGPVKAGKLGILVNLAKERVSGLKKALDEALDQRDDATDKVIKLEHILRKFKEEYNPNFNDEGVKAAIKSWEDYAASQAQVSREYMPDSDMNELLREDNEHSGINWAEFEEAEELDADIIFNFEAYLPKALRTSIREKILAVRVWMIDNGLLAQPQNAGESSSVRVAREAFEASERNVAAKSRDIEQAKEDLNSDYGPEGIFRALKDKCISINSGEYEYEVCWMGRTHQKSKKGHGQSHMGTFDKFSWEESDEEEKPDGKGLGAGKRLVLKYEDGQGCWNGPKRRTDVWLACHETEEIWKVMEAEKCVYKIEVGTPVVCDVAKAQEPQGKDEL